MDESNWIAIGALVVAGLAAIPGFVSLGRAKKANSIAAEALEASRESNEIAREANTIATDSEARARERNVVDFDWDWNEDGTATITNRGEGTAHDVTGYLTLNDETQQINQDLIGPGESFALDFPKTLRDLEAKAAEHAARLRRAQRRPENGLFSSMPSYIPEPQVDLDRYTFRISWVSPAGVTGNLGPQSGLITLSLNGD